MSCGDTRLKKKHTFKSCESHFGIKIISVVGKLHATGMQHRSDYSLPHILDTNIFPDNIDDEVFVVKCFSHSLFLWT